MTTEMRSFYTPSTTNHLASHAPAGVEELISKYSSMATSTASASAPTASSMPSSRMLRRRNIIQRFADRVRLEYYRYEVTFGIYVMTPGEKLVANSFIVVVLSLLLWALLLYFPSLLYHKLSRLVWLLTGREMRAALGITDTPFDAILPAFSPTEGR